MDTFPTIDDVGSASTMDIEDKFPDDGDDGEEDKPVPWQHVETKVWMKVEDMLLVDTENGKAMIVTLKKLNGTLYQSLDNETD